MPGNTRTQFLDIAEALFAERGFYGVSIAAIANELGLTKQALLHHFSSKAKLYGEVLQRISNRFESMSIDAGSRHNTPESQLIAYYVMLCEATQEHPAQTRLLMRELLDNQRRAESAETWYLKTFLHRLIDMLRAVPNWTNVPNAIALACIYQWLGAINYYGISGPTLTGIFGPQSYAAFDTVFKQSLEAQIAVVLAAGP